MPDDTELNPGTGGDKVRSKQRGGSTGPKSNIVIIDEQDGAGAESLADGGIRVKGRALARSAVAWTSGTSVDATLAIAVTGYTTVVLTLRSGTTITAGAIIFEVSDDGTNWYSIRGVRQAATALESGYTLLASDTQHWVFDVAGYTNFRVRLNPVITGSGTVDLGLVAQTLPAVRFVVLPQLPAALAAGGGVKVEGVSGGVAMPTMGDVAHDGVNAGNPVQVGYHAVAHGTSPTAVAAADRVRQIANRHGMPFIIGGHPNTFSYQIHTTGALTNQAIGPAVGSGAKMVVTQVQVTAANANTAFPQVRIGFGTTTTPADGTGTGQVGVVASHPGVPAGGGFSRGDGSGIIGAGADDEELRITSAAPTGGSLDITVSGYIVES